MQHPREVADLLIYVDRDAGGSGGRERGGVVHLHGRVLQAAAVIFCMIFWTFSSKVALVKGLTM